MLGWVRMGSIVLVVGLAAFALMACGKAEEVTLTASNFLYSPSKVVFNAGQNVRLVVNNPTETRHNFHIDRHDVESDIEPGQRQTFDWKVPDKTGVIKFGCEYHEDQGMEGEFEVR